MLVVVLFERDYRLKIMAMGFYVTLNLFFYVGDPFLIDGRGSFPLTSAQSFCSWKAESTNTDCTSVGLILGLFLSDWSTLLDFNITGQVCLPQWYTTVVLYVINLQVINALGSQPTVSTSTPTHTITVIFFASSRQFCCLHRPSRCCLFSQRQYHRLSLHW